MAYDFSVLHTYTKALQEMFKCSNCKNEYKKQWCKEDNGLCFYCTKFLPMRDSYSSILKDIEWYYYRQGETSRKVYYNEFLDNLEKWATRFSVLPTKQDLKTIEELRNVQDWTRNEPDGDYYY